MLQPVEARDFLRLLLRACGSESSLVVGGGGSGSGKATALLAASRGAHVVADRDAKASEQVASDVKAAAGKEAAFAAPVDIRDRESIRESLRAIVKTYGGFDILINTAAIFPAPPDGRVTDELWGLTLDLNVTANYRLAEEAAAIFREQELDGSIVLTSSANAVVAKRGSEAYDVSKAAVSHLIRELAIALAPQVRVNGISPATVVKGSTMFPRDRVITSLKKYGIAFDEHASDDDLRKLLADFYAKRTLTHQAICPGDCAQAILFRAGPNAKCTTGHLIPVDGGLATRFYAEEIMDKPVLVAIDLGAEIYRPLDAVYPIVYLDALMVKVRDEGHIQTKAIYVVLGVNLEGQKEVLGLWMSSSEGAKFWLGC
jgi:NAD(P)-dependent dehydrogenase (short-subunit alcohol dehydrogenase family)